MIIAVAGFVLARLVLVGGVLSLGLDSVVAVLVEDDDWVVDLESAALVLGVDGVTRCVCCAVVVVVHEQVPDILAQQVL